MTDEWIDLPSPDASGRIDYTSAYDAALVQYGHIVEQRARRVAEEISRDEIEANFRDHDFGPVIYEHGDTP